MLTYLFGRQLPRGFLKLLLLPSLLCWLMLLVLLLLKMLSVSGSLVGTAFKYQVVAVLLTKLLSFRDVAFFLE